MPKRLTDEAIAQYRREGYFFPIQVLDEAQVKSNRSLLEAFEQAQGKAIEGSHRAKSHLLFTWVDALMRHAAILDAVEDLIGPDLLCWNVLFWVKEAGSASFVSWHQDLRYWGLDADDLVTVWLALSPATTESGCMRVLPGSHTGDLLPHEDRLDQANLLTRGQEISVQVDESKAVAMPLRAGEASLHNVRLAHASGPNRSGDRRIGLSFHYMPTRSRQTLADWDSAALVCGEDRHGHFELTPRPTRDFDPATVKFHKRATDALRDLLYKDSDTARKTV